MNFKFNWKTKEFSDEIRLEINENMRNEIETSYHNHNIELSTQETLVSLFYDSFTDSVIGAVLSDKKCIDMIVTYSMSDNHPTTYTPKHKLS